MDVVWGYYVSIFECEEGLVCAICIGRYCLEMVVDNELDKLITKYV